MAWKATTTPGTQFKIDIGGTPLLLEGVTSLTAPGGSRPTSEWTPINATGKKYKTGRPAYGKASGEVAVMPTDPSFVKLLSLYNAAPSAALCDVEVALVDNGAKAYKWTAFCDEFGLSFPNEGVVKAKFGFQATTGATALGSPTSVTPNASFDPAVSQGTTLGFWVTSAYVTLNGVENIELQGGSRDSSPATPINATAASVLPGYHGQTKLSFDLLFDSTETNHLALLTSFNASTPVNDKFIITMADSGNATITLDPVVIDGWEWPTAPGTNRVKVSATVNCDIAIVP
jgi:hypothetical protein